MEQFPNITDFSHELLCQILKYLPLREILSVAMLCKKMATAVNMHLRLCKSIDFCQDAICGYMSSSITDDHLLLLLNKCPHLETVYGLHPVKIERRRLRKRSALTIPGIIEALGLCFYLKAVETSDLRLFEAIMQHLPHIEIIGHFQNRDGLFPPQASQRLKLQPYPRISSLHLIGVEVPELTAMPHLQHLHLQCVRFTKLQPFRAFLAQNLKSFVMKHCIGPSVPQRYLSLIIALSSSPNLNHLELVRVPLLNGLFQRAVEDSYRHNGFVNLRTLVISGCKGVLEADLGHLMIVSSKNLETLYIQPSLTKDSLFVSLSYAQCVFPRLQNLHLGYIDTLNSSGEWSNDALLSLGLAEVPDTPSSITDSGMKVISELFPYIKTMSVSNCPHLMIMYHWMSAEDNEAWSRLTDLTLQKCHCLQLSSFAVFISFLSHIEVVILNDMFREPPKGCSHVGLSAGTGLGMSSAVVSNQDEHIAVQGHHQDFEHPGDEENEENEREFIDVENEEPHFMVLQRDFFDGEEEEEDEDAVVDAVLDNQDPGVVLEQQNAEEHSNANNCGDHNALQVNEKASVNKNNFCNEPSSSGDDKSLASPSNAISSDIKVGNVHKPNYHIIYPSKSSSPSMKSVHVQCDAVSEESHKSSGSDTLKNSSFHTNDMSNDSYKSEDDAKICICSKLSDYNFDADYDPHKPSTSKAGSHLDYCVPCGGKQFKPPNSETDSFDEFRKNNKQSKESFEQKFLKTELGDNSHSSGIENNNASKIRDIPLSSQNHFNNLGSPGNKIKTSVKPCVVLINKLDSSSNHPDDSDITLDHVRNSFDNHIHTLVSHNSLENKSKFFSQNEVNECGSSNVQTKHTSFDCGNIEMLPDYPNSNDFLKQNDGILDENVENSVKGTDSLNDENVSDNICVSLERPDNTCSSKMLESCVECIELTENPSLQDDSSEMYDFYSLVDKDKDSVNNVSVESGEILKNYDNFTHESSSAKEYNYELMETEKFCDSIIKTENDSSHCYDNDYVTHKNEEQNDLNTNAALYNPQSRYDVSVHSPKKSKPRCKITRKMKNAYTISEGKKYQKDLSLNRDESFKSNKDIVKVKTEEILENETRNINFDTNDVNLSENVQCAQKVIKHITTNKKAKTSNLDTFNENSKTHGKELCETSRKSSFQNNYKIESRESSVTEKQNMNLVITLSETNIASNDMENSVGTVDDKNLSKPGSSKIHSNHSPMYDTCQPSVLSNKNDYDVNYAKSSKKANLQKQNGTNSKTSILQGGNDKNSVCSNIEGEKKESGCSTSDMLNKKSNLKCKRRSDKNSQRESELVLPATKRLKRPFDNYNKDLDDSKYYVSVSGITTDIVNSFTGESSRLPSCSVLLTRPDDETSKVHLRSEIKAKCCKCSSSEKIPKDFGNTGMNCIPNLPSTSRESQYKSVTEVCKLHTGEYLQNCGTSNKRVRKTYSTRINKRQSNTNKIEGGTQSSKDDLKKEYKCSKRPFCKCSENVCDHLTCNTSSLKLKEEKIKITNSDAAIIIRNQSERENLLNLPVESNNYIENNNVNTSENIKYSRQVAQKKESNRKIGNIKKYSDKCQNKNVDAKNIRSGPSEISVTQNSRKTRKKKKFSPQKQGKRLPKNFPGKPEHLNKLTRNSSKKIPAIPTISLISQGTQANSADIRRSVRRIRRATAQARRTMPPMRVSRNSSHSNKISAKVLNKKPVNMNPKPEMQDKATSTSDPLLEDDAIQTLQLTSKTLLSFTVVSCGISDFIIDHCPKLFHIEVQACRILKKFHLNYCPAMKRLNISQCPKLSICALASPVMAVKPDSYFLVSYEPCMQGYHPGEGEKAILSRAALDQSVLICHDISAISHEGFQAMFKEKLIEWFHYLSKVHAVLKPLHEAGNGKITDDCKTTAKYVEQKILDISRHLSLFSAHIHRSKSKNESTKKFEESRVFDYPWCHDLRRFHGKYTSYLPSTDFCHSDGRYELVTNNPIFCDIFETHQLETGFPAISDCDAHRNISLISHEAREKSAKIENKFIGFYIPVTENNQINF